MAYVSKDIALYKESLRLNPKSRAFVLLAEAYGREGQHTRALSLATKGVQEHPEWTGAHLCLGRLYLQMGEPEKAKRCLHKALELDPKSIMAHKLLGESFLYLKQIPKALSIYKQCLFLAPQDTRAREVVKKLESLSAEEYDADVFQVLKKTPAPKSMGFSLERVVSLADAYVMRNELTKALKTLNEGEALLGPTQAISDRVASIQLSLGDASAKVVPHRLRNARPENAVREKQINHLRLLLRRVNHNRKQQ